MSEVTGRYFLYGEIEKYLEETQASYPDLVELMSIGRSYEGRDIWVAAITQKITGPHLLKPAIYVDANHHAGEVTGSAVCLGLIEHLTGAYGKDKAVTELLDKKVFYILPRVSPDGSELYLTTPYSLRSSVRPYPDEDLGEGLVPEDMDENGIILQMRWEDPAGQWKVSEKDPRIMARRKPGDVGGKYYRMASEGFFANWDGVEIKQARPKWGLDLNRNYPGHWLPANQQSGAGPYPMSEPETRAVGEFFLSHPNIAMTLSFHTTGGIILRPRTAGADRDMPQADLSMYKAMGRRGREITGYPCVSIFEGFTFDQRRPSTGSFLDFSYDVRGIASYGVELWDLQGRAGIPKREMRQTLNLTEDERENDEVKVMAYIDKELGGEGFIPWTEFNHPQLGLVEIGGLHPKLMRQNAPLKLLPDECEKSVNLAVMLAATMPELGLFGEKTTQIGAGEYEFVASLKNVGYLPTSSTQQAQAVRAVKPIKVKIQLAEDVTLLAGKPYDELPHLPGWGSSMGGFGLERKLRFLFKADESFTGGKLADIAIQSERAGTIHKEIMV